MLSKVEIEIKIRQIKEIAASIGLSIPCVIVEDPKIISRLEQCDAGLLGIKLKPTFFSAKNYRFKAKHIPKEEYGRFEEIKFMKKILNEA